MKKIYRIIIALVLFASLESCISLSNRSENPPVNYLEGYLSYYATATDFVLSKYLQNLDIVLKANEYIHEEDFAERELIEHKYFLNNKVRYYSEDQEFIMNRGYESELLVKINTFGTDIRTEGSIWNVTYNTEDNESIKMTIQSLGGGNYKLSALANYHTEYIYVVEMELDINVTTADTYYQPSHPFMYKIDELSSIYTQTGSEDLAYSKIQVGLELVEPVSALAFPTGKFENFGNFIYYDGGIDFSLDGGGYYDFIDDDFVASLQGTPEDPILVISSNGDELAWNLGYNGEI